MAKHDTPLYWKSVKLRDLVLRKPLNLQFSKKELAEENDSVHIVKLEKEKVIGCLVLKPLTDSVLKMRQVAVHPDYQRKGRGKELVYFSEEYAKQNNFTLIELHARDVAIPFYEQLRYQTVGDWFKEVGIQHKKMVKDI